MRENDFQTKKVTIYTVAERAGVSIATVSRIANGQYNGKDEVRRTVETAMADLDYHPSHLARGLTGSKIATQMVGVVAPFFIHPFFTEVLKGIYRSLHSNGYHLVLYDVDSRHMKKKMLEQIRRERRIDGLLLVSMHLNRDEYDSLTEQVPVVLVASETDFADSVTVDNYHGASSAVRHLHNLGHRNIAFINNQTKIPETAIRERAVRDTVQVLGMQCKIDYRAVDRRSGYLATQTMLENNAEVTSVFYYSDLMAYGGLDYVNERQIRDKICLVGFDGFETTIHSRLTTIVQPMEEMGARGAELLLDRIEHPTRELRKIILETWLSKGETCGSSVREQQF